MSAITELTCYREYPPSKTLAPFVRAYFTFSSCSNQLLPNAISTSSTEFCPALFADCGTSLIIKFSGDWRVDGLAATQTDQYSGVVVGPITRGRATYIGQGVDAIGAYFFPGALARFTALPLVAIANDAVAVENVFGMQGRDCMAAMSESLDISQRLRLLELFLTRVALGSDNVQALRWQKLCNRFSMGDQFSVERAAIAAGISRQYLTRLFRQHVGVTPKVFARVARLHQVLRRVNDQMLSSWADVAAQFGYADQSHLIAEFREFTTLTPAMFIDSRRFHPFVA